MRPVDVVVVSYNSSNELRACVEPLAGSTDVDVTVVDNNSSDGSLAAIEGLDVRAIALETNRGFAHGCNVGWRAGSAPYVLFLNPDARLDTTAIEAMLAVLEQDERVGAVGPRIVDDGGALDHSIRRFPRLRSTYAQAFFLHRLLPDADWTDETVHRTWAYEEPAAVEWISGACMLFRRSVLEALGGLDEGFFMYCEDKDLCRRTWDLGYEVRYEPSSAVVHVGGASAPRAALLPVLAASKIRYAQKHEPPIRALAERLGVGLQSLTHVVVSQGGRSRRAGHLRSLLVALGVGRQGRPPVRLTPPSEGGSATTS